MPWKGKTVAQTRREFVERVLNHEKTKAALCREYGICRHTGEKWLKRWKDGQLFIEGASGGLAASRRPFGDVRRTPPHSVSVRL